MTKTLMKHVCAAALAGAAVFGAGPAFALTDQQVAGINSGALDLVKQCSIDSKSVPESTRKLAITYTSDAREAAEVTGALLSAVQSASNSKSCLFSVGQGVTKFALSYGDTNPTAISIGTTIGQIGKVATVNGCVNTAGVNTKVGLACDPPTGDLLQGRAKTGSTFAAGTGETASHLTDAQVSAINSGALDLVQDFTLNPGKTPEAARILAASNTKNPAEAPEVTGAILSAVQKVSDNRDLLFAVGQGVTKFALSYGDSNPTAISIGTTIGQIGKVATVNGCVNAAGVGTQVGLACDPVTSDLLQGRASEGSTFGSTTPEGQVSHLSDNQVAAINSGALDIVQNFTLDPDKVPEQTRVLAASNTNDPSQAAEVTGAILSAVQKVSENPSGLFAVGEGVTKFALSYGDTNPTAVSIGTTIGQIGSVPVVNACVNTAGVGTQVGLACDPPTSDILQGRSSDSPAFGSGGENPGQDDPSPH